jgi:ribonucleotide monophosphatase NagD (HAD superfamily)
MTDSPPPAVARYSSLSSLIPLYDAFVLDQFGMLHDGLDLRSVSASDADLVLIAGSEGERRTLGSYAEELAPLARAGVPAMCLDPDRTMLTPRGFAFGAGQIAELYQRLGGAVTWIGQE